MMRVLDTVRLKRLGLLACVESDGPCPLNGSQLRRVADGQVWIVKGVERFGIHLDTPGRAGEKIGILLSDGSEPAIGDELERVRFSEAERAALERAAERTDQSISEWARQALLSAATEAPGDKTS